MEDNLSNIATLLLGILFLNLVGCAAALVPATSDPNKKLDDAYFLIDNGRSLPARKLIGEALEIWQSRKDDMNVARAHSAFGDLYRNGRAQGKLTLPDYPLAVQNYERAVDAYTRMERPKWVALNLWPIAASYQAQGNNKAACEILKKALQVYKGAPNSQEATEPFEKAGAFSVKTIEQELQSFKCK